MVLLFADLYFSYSQSSMATLFVVAAAVTLVAAATAPHGVPCSSRPPSPSSSRPDS